MQQRSRDTTIYYETADSITLIEDVDDIDFFLFERESLARTMGYTPVKNKDKTLDIFDEGELVGTYFHKQHLN